ncbi:MAG: hypothetical protein V4498_08830, partial [candidate division FCPU426 bacterium]
CFVAEGDGIFTPAPQPTPKPTLKPTLKPTPQPARATAVPTAEPEEDPEESVEAVPVATPKTVASSNLLSIQVRSPVLTSAASPVARREVEVARTATPLKTPAITPTPAKIPTPVSTRAATVVPTKAATPMLTKIATPVPLRKAKGRSVAVAQATRNPTPAPRQTAAARSWTWKREPKSTGSSIQTSGYSLSFGSRDRDQLSRLMFSLPIGWGKPYDVKPAFKPDASYLDSRNIDMSVFTGLGVEYRFWRWLRLFADWNVHQHQTLAADTKSPAVAVDVPGQTSLIADQKIFYVMETHGFRLGGRLGLPLGRYEPWVGGGYGVYAWNAEYRDNPRTTTYGDDHGTEWGWTGQVGLDINFIWGGALFRVTPFGELGSPVVYPTVGDIAGTGSDWHDNQGTAIMVPRRLGIMFSLGY